MSKQPYTEVVEQAVLTSADDLNHEHVDDHPILAEAPGRRWYFGDGMSKRVLGVVVAFLVLGLLWYAYQRHLETQANEGAVTVDDSGPRVVTETTADTPVVKKTVAPAVTTPTVSAATSAVVPPGDSIAPNPTNGMAFGGSGKFQVYRQGNLTWRVDTETGKTCIVFATMEEWKKPIVYQHGCANS